MLKANDGRAYLGRNPSYTREQFNQVCAMLGRQAIAQNRPTHEADPADDLPRSAGAEAVLAAWGGLPTHPMVRGNIGAEGPF
jgi:hypothetical protein